MSTFGHYAISEQPTEGCAYVARVAFEYGLHVFKVGDDFDYKALGLTEGQAANLFVAGRLLVKPAIVPAAPPSSKQQQRAARK